MHPAAIPLIRAAEACASVSPAGVRLRTVDGRKRAPPPFLTIMITSVYFGTTGNSEYRIGRPINVQDYCTTCTSVVCADASRRGSWIRGRRDCLCPAVAGFFSVRLITPFLTYFLHAVWERYTCVRAHESARQIDTQNDYSSRATQCARTDGPNRSRAWRRARGPPR